MRKLIQIMVLACFVFLNSSHVLAHNVYITNGLKQQEFGEFDCRSRVYAYVKWDALKPGEHILSADWITPNGKLQEHAQYRFMAPLRDSWVWLELRGGQGSGLMKSFNPQYGFEEFIGLWAVKIYLDEKLIGQKGFYITC